MSLRPGSSTAPIPSGDALRVVMERSIDDLAELARGDVEPGQFFADVLKRALHPGGASQVVLWRATLEGRWDPAGEMPPSEGMNADRIAERQELLDDIAGDSQPRIFHDSREPAADTNGASQVFSPLRHAGATVGILETIHRLPPGASLSPAVFQFFAALAEITADFLSQQELQQLRRAKSTWQQWDQYQLRLGQSLELGAVCATVANDGRAVLGCDRITVLVRRGRRYRVEAVSGVERVDPRSGAVQSLEVLTRQVAVQRHTCWLSPRSDGAPVPDSDPMTDSVTDHTAEPMTDPALESAVERYRHESGAACLGAVPLTGPRGDASTDPPDAVIVCENFHADGGWAEVQPRAESLMQRSSFALRAAIERDEVPWFTAWQRLRHGGFLMHRPGTALAALIAVGIVIALIVVPAEFTITGQGELWPNVRRDVFATTSGVVDQILVSHGTKVQPDQPLIVLRDPELEQDVPRVSGEIATTLERLRGVQIARLTGGVTPDAVVRARHLTAEEEELKERLETLERQRALVEERRQRLTLRSPIAGRVLTWDVTQHLSARPVERGQSLLTIGETGGPWVVEIQVADKDAGHMLRARKTIGPALEVEFQLPSEPGRIHRGKVRDVSLASESDDRSTGHVRVVVEFDSAQVEQLRPGATAIPRIHCGRRPLGYVWLHDLIDAIRVQLLF
jgi:multidrug efflux pump subunit AcrA (membrane-fusion protein)